MLYENFGQVWYQDYTAGEKVISREVIVTCQASEYHYDAAPRCRQASLGFTQRRTGDVLYIKLKAKENHLDIPFSC